MNQDMEENFPRGGKKVSSAVKRKPKNDTLFGNAPKKQKKEKRDKKDKKEVVVDYAPPVDTKMLSRQSIVEGMILLACVKKVTEHSVEVELPGLNIAKVMLDSISDDLVKILKQSLSNDSKITSVTQILNQFFHCGQFVPLRIKSVNVTEDKSFVLGSVAPKDVYSGRFHNSFHKGELMWASVASELDHGYQLDCGVKNCRIFLPSQQIDENTKLEIGQPIWCRVHNVESSNAASTLKVGIKRQHIDSVLSNGSVPLSSITPGTKVEVFVEKVTGNGIHCKFLEDYTGFIHESQLQPAMRKLSSIKEATVMCAYLLYVENISKVARLSMRGLNSAYEVVFERGAKVSAQVIGKNELGVYFKLNNQEKGWISNKRLLNTKKFSSANLENIINQKFAKGSNHMCVVLSYCHMDRVYVCGVEKELLEEKYFSPKDFEVGQLVEGKIQEIKENGIVLAVGQVKAFIPNIHLTDSLYTDLLKKKFVEGKTLQARVFSSSEKTVILTLKSLFLKEDALFKDLQSIDFSKTYPALVLKAKSHGLILTFYNNIEGYIPVQNFNFQITQEYNENPSSFFFSGQSIQVRVTKLINSHKVMASLKLKSGTPTVAPQIGMTVSGIVKKKQKKGLLVSVSKLNINGFVPVEHLSIDLSLCQRTLDTFKVKDEIPELMILKHDEKETILSRREAIAYDRCDFKVPKFQNVKKNTILRCSVESIEKNGIFVSTPIKNLNKKFFVKNKNISREKTIPKYQVQQAVLGKVLEVDHANETIELSLISDKVFDKNAENAISFFTEYLEDENRLEQYGLQNHWPINKYRLCERVLCTVEESTSKGCLVKLPNGCNGLVVSSLSTAVRKGDKVTGMVLGHNYQLNYVELCLKESIINSINPKQDGVLPEDERFFTVNKILTREQYILAVTRKSANRQLVYIPLRLCENDSIEYLKKYYENDAFKVDVCGKFGDKLIGLHRKLKYSLDYTFILKNTNWSELDTSLVNEELDVASNSNGNADRIEEASDDDVVYLDETQASVDEDVKMEDTSKESDEENDVEMKELDISEGHEIDDAETKESGNGNQDSGLCSNSLDGKSDQENESENEDEIMQNGIKSTAGEEHNNQNKTKSPFGVLSSVSNFFSPNVKDDSEESSSDDEEDEHKKPIEKKTKMKKLQKTNNEDESQEAESAENYEKLLLKNPNSSTLWLKYIAFCLSVQEFEKARSIGKKALSSINTTCEDDKFNIWMTLLSIENLYGTKESFEDVFEEAVRRNDAFKVYVRVTDLLLKSGKHEELEEKIRKMRMKFKQEPSMWVHVAKLYYLMGNFKEARNLKNMCLKSITIKKEQYNLILKFAILEFTHGEIDNGILIFESVLVTYPNKIGAWLVYIDQLVSKKQIKEARDVLRRALDLSLPIKSMKIIYHKFRVFEENHGTPETLAAFKEKAKHLLQEKLQAVSS